MAATATNGILLLSSSMYSFPTNENTLPSSSSSSASSSRKHSMPPTPQKKIRFAPLPDPRRSVLVADDGSELPLNYQDELASLPCPPLLAELAVLSKDKPTPLAIPHSILDVDSDSLDSSSTRRSSSKGADSSTTTPTASASDSVSSFTQESPSLKTALPPIPNPLLAAKIQKHYDEKHNSPKIKPRSLFRPFLRRPNSSNGSIPTVSSTSNTPSASSSTSTLHPHPKHAPFPRINLSSPSLGLFRVGPRHPRHDDDDSDSKGGGLMSLARWTGSSSSVNNPKSQRSHTHNGYPHTQAVHPSPLNPLSRTSSIQSIQSTGAQTPFGSTASLPLTRTDSGRLQNFSHSSTVSLSGRRPSTAGALSSSSQLALGSTVLSSPPRKGKGTRMLNGRVYGHRRGASGGNPFANARDEADPEFVEWGYGGMGSVRNGAGVGSNVWERLQRGGTVLGGSEEGVGKKEGVGGGGELDDGSGMGWVRKRREERERMKREKEEQERQEKEKAAERPLEVVVEGEVSPDVKVAESQENVFEKAEEVEQVKDRPDTAATITPTRLATATPTPTTPDPSKSSEKVNELDEHMTRAVNVPAPTIRRHSSHGRTHSKESFHEIIPDEKSVVGVEEKGEEADAEESEESEDDGSRSDESEEESEEDDDEDELESKRKTATALGAGVEKVTRHKT